MHYKALKLRLAKLEPGTPAVEVLPLAIIEDFVCGDADEEDQTIIGLSWKGAQFLRSQDESLSDLRLRAARGLGATGRRGELPNIAEAIR